MAISLEEVERLREKSGAGYEACKDALERTEGDLLDALIFLERTGRSCSSGSTFTTNPKKASAELVKPPEKAGGKRQGKQEKRHEADWRDWLRDLGEMGLNLLRHATANQFEVWRRGEMMTSIPVLILVLLLIVSFWISIPLMLLGLFLGCRYCFTGPDLGKDAINRTLENVSGTVGDMVDQLKDEYKKAQEKNKKN
ncbi:MAG: ubiquitin [Pseudoflavonifractor sp.]